MQDANNVIDLQAFKRCNTQELMDDIGARAYLFLRDQAKANDLELSQVIAEHMLGLSLVLEAVEGPDAARHVLQDIQSKIG